MKVKVLIDGSCVYLGSDCSVNVTTSPVFIPHINDIVPSAA